MHWTLKQKIVIRSVELFSLIFWGAICLSLEYEVIGTYWLSLIYIGLLCLGMAALDHMIFRASRLD